MEEEEESGGSPWGHKESETTKQKSFHFPLWSEAVTERRNKAKESS